jgi:uncharacterized DUF497 family protein
MPWLDIIWTEENEKHILEHGVTREEVEQVVRRSRGKWKSRSSKRPVLYGQTRGGREIAVVFEFVDAITIFPVTAYEI